MSATASILKLDVKGVTRDNVMLMNIFLSFAVMVTITVIGLFKADTDWAEWFPFMVILSLLTGPPAYGFLFGLLMVDERDTGVRSVLAVSPVPPTRLLLVRTLTAIALMLVWPIFTIQVMNATWHAVDLPLPEWLALIAMLSLGAPVTALAVAAFADNKVEAMALFKGINFTVLAPLALYFLPDAGYRDLFLVLPATWGVYAFDALLAGGLPAAAGWLLGGAVYLGLLLVLAVRAYIRRLYRMAD